VIAAAANSLVRVLLEPSCAACGSPHVRPFDGPLCALCRGGLVQLSAPLCVVCGEPLASSRTAGPLCPRCDAGRPSFQIARSVGRYDGSLREIIHAFKYRRRRALAEPLASWMVESGADLLDAADAVVPVPLHPRRWLERGFNQADDLARLLGRPVWHVLRRVRHGSPQAGLAGGARRANVHGAFALAPWWRSARALRFRPPRLRNAVVVLIDDVMTTGATLDACSRVLVDAGVRRVAALTVARSASAPRARPLPPRRPSAAPRR
jgi:ComF family protein